MVGILVEALQIHERNFPLDLNYVVYANYLGLLFMNSEQNQEAILYLDKCLSVFSSGLLEKDLSAANAHNNLGLIRYYRTEYELAADHFEQAGKLFKKLSEGYSENYMMLLSNLASLYYSWGKSDRMEESYLLLGDYLESYGERLDLAYIQGLENMAHFYASSGDIEASEAFLQRATLLRKKMSDQSH
jgi:tetratricopeptide (TPR) repeat protein